VDLDFLRSMVSNGTILLWCRDREK